MELRPYQTEAVSSILSTWESGVDKALLSVFTGGGKTIIFAKVIENRISDGSHTLVLAHREELLSQASDKINFVTGLDTALEKAESTAVGSGKNIVVASVQTLSNDKRLSKYPRDYFSTIIIDEAHHTLADSYMKILKYFDCAKVLGVTATIDRGDKRNLSEYYETIAYEINMRRGIKEGYLVPIKAQMIPLELDISNVSISKGDYALGEVGNALEPYLNQIALEMVKYCKGRKTVVFLPLVKISQDFCELLNLHGLNAVEVNGNSKDREKILKQFHDGEYDVLCNSMLLTEGWDEPAVDCIVVLRPTKVRGLYQQMVGRGTRLCEGKKDLLLLDFLWMTQKHDLCHPSSLICESDNLADRVLEKITNTAGEVDILEAEDDAKRDVIKEKEEALKRELEENKKKARKMVDPIEYGLSINDEDLVDYEPTMLWEQAPASQKQLEALEKWGIDTSGITCAGLASTILDRLFSRKNLGLATPKQIRALEKYGFYHVGEWSFDAASKMINLIAGNNWKTPYWIDVKSYRP